MTLWGANNFSNNQPNFLTRAGAGGDPLLATTQAANHGNTIFGANTTSGISNKGAHSGWVKVVRGTGYVIAATIAAAGSGYANNETIVVSNATSNATLTLSTNATGNITGVAVTSPGAGWTNSSVAVVTFQNQSHLTTVTIAGTASGYSNTDTIRFANGIINATATFVTNSTGGFVTANVTITNVGLFPNALANNQLAVSILAANGSASAGSGATATGGLANGTGGSVTVTMGGRAGRKHYECIVATGSLLANGGGSEYSNL